MHILSKVGQKDNVNTYEYICDTNNDLPDAAKEPVTLGSIALVLEGAAGGLEIYMANSNGVWKNLIGGSQQSSDSESGT